LISKGNIKGWSTLLHLVSSKGNLKICWILY
jgi:hypothetical protein